jgi:hypothetical protein
MILIKYVDPFCGSVGGPSCVEARLEYFHRSPASHRKGKPGAWKYKWATLSLGDINTGT